jgi:hypothetical protein
MNPKASATRKIAAFRMLPYTRRVFRPQLGCLVLTLILLALPLAVTTQERAPILVPLAIELVPLGTDLQSPPASLSHLPSLVAPARLVLGPLPWAVFVLNPDTGAPLQNIMGPGFPDSSATDCPHGRSPPSD